VSPNDPGGLAPRGAHGTSTKKRASPYWRAPGSMSQVAENKPKARLDRRRELAIITNNNTRDASREEKSSMKRNIAGFFMSCFCRGMYVLLSNRVARSSDDCIGWRSFLFAPKYP